MTVPHVRGSDITNIARCRWAVAIDQYGDLPIFVCPYTGVHIRSKGYVAFHLKPDQSAWSFLGIVSPPMPKTNPRLTDETEKLHHYIQLDIEPPAALPLPAIDSLHNTGNLVGSFESCPGTISLFDS